MFQDCLGRSQSPLEMELLAVESGEKKDLFEAAIENNRNLLYVQVISIFALMATVYMLSVTVFW